MNAERLAAWFENARETLENAYLSHTEPWRQSGMSGPEERWTSLRKPVAECIDRSGTFLDVGCANGYLLECLLRWTAERDVHIEPFGVDCSARLLALAKERLPEHAGRLFHANAYDWVPPRRFDVVRTELVYVPGEHEGEFLARLLRDFVAPGGRLLVANYAEGHPIPEAGVLPGSEPTRHLLARLETLGFPADDHRDGHDPTKGRTTRVAILLRDSHDPAADRRR